MQRTNFISSVLLSFAGNPFGTYEQEEPCVHCGAALERPAARSMVQRLATRTAHIVEQSQRRLLRPRAAWIHARFETLGHAFRVESGG